ncbi:MAG: NUMOD3 domain-containing DNA-binding protein [Candidatus Izemoplasma sp.]
MNKNKYCVYLTVYEGTKLPPFYIGSTSIENLNNGYHGSINSLKYKEIYRQELRENPQLFDSVILEEFEDRKDALEYELKVQKEKDVVKSEQYMNMAFASVNGFFGRSVKGKDSPMYGRKHTEKTKQKMSEAKMGKNNPLYGKPGKDNPMYGNHHSEESKKKISIANSGENHYNYRKPRSQATKDKISEAKMGKKYYNNGMIEKSFKDGQLIPEGYVKGRLAQKQVICPHCLLEGSIINMKRYHFDNCKRKA